ncbi:Ldh family oxidoreductase [Micromonospora sp. NPDC005206]|uniref:Ldh family oxidoreductase n=1 Tax=Micromonospora sp. NPDC005206 TaxID=3157022 RepID=UPI0033B4B158
MIVDAERLHGLITTVLEHHGAPADAARTQADVLLEGDLRGQHSHGLQRLPVLVARIRARLIVPNARPEFWWPVPGFAVVDGRRGFGPVVGMAVVDELVKTATAAGVAVAAVRSANHLGMLAPYVERIADRGAIGLALTTSEALVHPWGGRRAMVGTNPIGLAVPTGGQHFVLDMSTAAVSRGKILNHALTDRPLEPGWAVDVAGEPTTAPQAAVEGALSPFGGPKGYALGLGLELLVAVLSGTETGERVLGTLDTEHPSTKGDLFFVFYPSVLGRDDFVERVSAYLDEVRTSATAPGFESVDVPGDRAARERARRLADGIPIDDEVWKAAEELLP